MSLNRSDKLNVCGVVVIGRNEGEKLITCLESILSITRQVVYVDSGSTDCSVKLARELGVGVVELDLSIPFTAARARNDGFASLREQFKELRYVQFLDGDCEMVEGWLCAALEFLESRNDVAVVCGRRLERFPHHSVYNMLCDIEWDTPIGESKACGGDALIRVGAFEKVGGFKSEMIAGEEPELCVRLRQAGWKIWRIDKKMTLHDASITSFKQWWIRSVRAGYAFAEGAHLHGRSPERHWIKEVRSLWVWGLGIPVLSLLLTIITGVYGLGLLALYPIQIARLSFKGNRGPLINLQRAFFLVMGKFPETLGAMKFSKNRFRYSQGSIIEYK